MVGVVMDVLDLEKLRNSKFETVDFSVLNGKFLRSVIHLRDNNLIISKTTTEDEIVFQTDDNEIYIISNNHLLRGSNSKLVTINGNLNDLIGYRIVDMEEVCTHFYRKNFDVWTFFRLKTILGTVEFIFGDNQTYYETEPMCLHRVIS